MKTLKLALVAAFLGVLLVNAADAKGFTPKNDQKVIYLPINIAIQNPELLAAMYQQLDPRFLEVQQLIYTQSVNYNNYVVRISGTFSQWAMFFKHVNPDYDIQEVKPGISSLGAS